MIPSHVKVWQNSNRSGAVDGSALFDAAVDTTVYVEGALTGADMIRLNWKRGALTWNDCDRVKVTVFFWLGPLNVPQYSIHQYVAAGAGAGSKWDAVANGVIATGAGTSDVTIRWTAGAVVGRATYVASSQYSWNLDVNVVKIELQMTTDQILYFGPPRQDADMNPGGNLGLIWSRDPADGNAKVATLRVLSLQGPSVNGANRGVRFMEMGFIQNVRITNCYGDYDQFAPPRRHQNNLQDGAFRLDIFTGPPASTAPWESSAFGDAYLQPVNDDTLSNLDFISEDVPRMTADSHMGLTIGADSDLVDRFGVIMDFREYFAIRSLQDVNGASGRYTQRAYAAWQFDGSGTIGMGASWTLTGTGNTGSSSFSEVTDGSLVPVTTGATINDLFPSSTWQIINQ